MYADEIAGGGASLFGTTALERAETRMWLRRADLEICEPVTSYYRNDPDTVDFYRGNRIPCPEARLWQKVNICQALNRFDDELEDKKWLCGDRFSAADIHFYGLMKPMCTPVPFLNDTGRKNLAAWWERMDSRPASKKALECFAEGRLHLTQ
jgi:glutathione S-transferase